MINQILLVIEMKSLARLFKKDAPYLTLIIKIKQMFLSFPECLVQQASFGSTPSTLILSYLNHGITTKVWYIKEHNTNTLTRLHVKLFLKLLLKSFNVHTSYIVCHHVSRIHLP